MRKSLLVTLYFPPQRGGISNSLWNICNNLPHHKIAVLAKQSNIEPEASFPIYRKKLVSQSNFVWPKWLWLFWHIFKIIKKEKITLLQAGQILPIGTAVYFLHKILKIPYIVYVYGQDLIIVRHSKRKIGLIKRILANAEFVIANSNYTKKLSVQLGATTNKTIVVYPSPIGLIRTDIDQQYFEYFLKQYDLSDKKIILSVGNLVERKGQDIVIKAMPEIIKQFPNAVYCIVGSGEHKKALEKLVKDSDLQNHVRFYEHISDQELPYFYHACHVFIMPSRELKNSSGESIDVEGFGIVYLEANLFSKPVIGGKSGGVIEAIEDGKSGLLVDPMRADDIAEKICKLLEHPEYAQKLGSYGKLRATNEFQWNSEVEKIKKIL